MFSAAFIFEPGTYDARFHTLDAQIEAAARAKRHYQQWYKGFHIVISEVIRSYGEGALNPITPNARQRNFTGDTP
jgi:hypothetical protein